MDKITIGNYSWQKFIGDEGQDVYIANFIESEDKVLGQFVDEEHYDILIDGDTDLYLPSNSLTDDTLNEDRIAFKFRKGVFTQEEQDGALEGLFDAAVESNNRGLAAGPREGKSYNREWVTTFQTKVLDWYAKGQPANVDGSDPIQEFARSTLGANGRGEVWLTTAIEKEFGTYENFFPECMRRLAELTKGLGYSPDIHAASIYAKRIREECISDTSYATAIWSGIAGFYGRYPRIPYGRATSYVDHNREKFEKSYPFARKLDKTFAELLPVRYGRQKVFADRLDNRFLIGEDTTFTTITVNTTTKDRNARMACHRDQGSLVPGFSNLTVISDGKRNWKGGYLVCPEVRVAINVRPGDLLLVDNMRVIHGNTPIEAPDSGEDDLMRMSLVYYFREDMDKLGSWEYESYRKQYVDDRRLNKDHRLWREYWNGVSPNMWSESEWYEYLEQKGGKSMVMEYHPEAYQQAGTLEEFFG